MSNNHVPAAIRNSFAWFAPARATGNHLSAQNDEPEHDEAAAAEADLKDLRDPWAARRAREEQAGQVERVMKPHLWGDV